MKILFCLVLLALISCGGKGGGSAGVGGAPGPGGQVGVTNNLQYPYGNGSGFETLEKFKSSVENNQWAQNPFFRNYNIYQFNYRNPSDTTGCTKIGSGFFSFSYCLDQGNKTPYWITDEKKGVITNALIAIDRIKDLVRRAVVRNPSLAADPSVPYVERNGDGYNTQWIIILGTETFVFYPWLPLGANPIYYKNTANNQIKEYSLANFNYSFQP